MSALETGIFQARIRMDGEGNTEAPLSSKDDSAAGLAIPHTVKFGYTECVVTGNRWMVTCQKCNKHVQDNARVISAFTKYK